MSQRAAEPVYRSGPAHPIPEAVLARIQQSRCARAVIRSDGVIAALNPPLLAAIGFAADDNLTGLAVTSLWPHKSRAELTDALSHAQDNGAARLQLDLAYVKGTEEAVEVTLAPAEGGAIVMSLAT